MDEDEGVDELPFMVPGCLSHQAVKLLVSQGLPVGALYRAHLKVAACSNGELQAELIAAQAKHDGLVALDPTMYAKGIAALQAEVGILQVKLDALGWDDASSVIAPGAESDVVGKLNLLLSRHLNNMAKEDEEHTSLLDDLANQVAVLQAKSALAVRHKQAKDKVNDELKEALELKVAYYASSDVKREALDLAAAKLEVEKAINQSLSPQWLEQRGMAGLPKEGLQAIILEAFKLASAMPRAFAKVAPNAMAGGVKRPAAGGFPEEWVDSEAGDM
jgi:hypothetical protein